MQIKQYDSQFDRCYLTMHVNIKVTLTHVYYVHKSNVAINETNSLGWVINWRFYFNVINFVQLNHMIAIKNA